MSGPPPESRPRAPHEPGTRGLDGGLEGQRRQDTIEAGFPVPAVARPREPPECAYRPVDGEALPPRNREDLHAFAKDPIRARPRPALRPVEPVVDHRGVAVLAPLRQHDPEDAGNGREVGHESHADIDPL